MELKKKRKLHKASSSVRFRYRKENVHLGINFLLFHQLQSAFFFSYLCNDFYDFFFLVNLNQFLIKSNKPDLFSLKINVLEILKIKLLCSPC